MPAMKRGRSGLAPKGQPMKQRKYIRINRANRGAMLNRGELKYVDADMFTSPPTPVSGTPTFTLLNGTAAGTGASDRIGTEITMKSISVRGTWLQNTSLTSGTSNYVRMLLVYDSQSNGSAPTAAELLTGSGMFAHKNLDNRKRFKILKDKLFILLPTSGSNSSGGPQAVNFKFYRKLNAKTEYKGTTAAITSIATGAIYLVCLAQAAANGPSFTGSSRIRYDDR